MLESRSHGSRPYTAPEWDRVALITIDVQRDFAEPGAPAEVPGTMEAIPAMADVLDGFRKAGRPIIHMVRMYRPDGSNADRCRRQAIKDGNEIVAPDTEGAQLVADLLPRNNVRLDAETLLNGDINISVRAKPSSINRAGAASTEPRSIRI